MFMYNRLEVKIMFEKSAYSGNRDSDYPLVIKQLEALLKMEENIITKLSNSSALLNQYLDDVNWVGYYLYDNVKQNLVLGPFQGLPACTRIMIGSGVCGTCASTLETQLVADVHCFEGHIACDAKTNSEIVVPIVKDGKLYGVLDIDSPSKARFDEIDQKYLEMFVKTLEMYL
jgi:GAF domain-containing protein